MSDEVSDSSEDGHHPLRSIENETIAGMTA
jgi:hypothetical protein